MLNTRAGEIIGNVPKASREVEPEALTVPEAARVSGISRTVLYQAMNQDPRKRKGLPYLAFLKAGRSRRVRLSTLRAWLADLEWGGTR